MKNVMKVIRIDDFEVYLCREDELSYTENSKFILQDKMYGSKSHESVVYDLMTSAEVKTDSCVLYDGNVVDKKSFSLKLQPKEMLPLVQDCVKSNFKELVYNNEFGSVHILKNYVRSGFIVESKVKEWIADVFYKIEKVLGKSSSLNKFPYLNLIAWKTAEVFYLSVFPRVVHRPTQYYSQDSSHLKIEPGASDLGGCIVVKGTDLFERLDGELIKNIFQQVAFSRDHLQEIVLNIDFE